jgi:hypothetical protein
MRRLCELQTIRAGTVAGLTEWKNRRGSGITDDLALSLAETTIQHLTSQLEAVDQATMLSAKRDLLVSINGVGEALAGIVLPISAINAAARTGTQGWQTATT